MNTIYIYLNLNSTNILVVNITHISHTIMFLHNETTIGHLSSEALTLKIK